jgi:hypothetical protein
MTSMKVFSYRKVSPCFLEGPAAEVDDLLMRHAVELTVVKVIGMFGKWQNYMAGYEEESFTFTTFAEIETPIAFKIREGPGSNLKAKSRSEWDVYVHCWV